MANAIKSILMIGSITGQTKQRFRALCELGYPVETIKETADNHAPGINYAPTFLDRVRYKLGYPADKQHINPQVLSLLKKKSFDLLWVEKALSLKPSTLKKVKTLQPSIKLAWYSGDDMFARHNQSAYFRQSLPLYDLIFTTKSYNAHPHELPALGAQKVYFVDKGFDPVLHAPVAVTEQDQKKWGADVGFIGTFELERALAMRYLAEHGILVRIWGNNWERFAKTHAHPNLHIELKPIYDEDYQRTICATKINLCFLRKLNRDLQTDRSIEIPACGAFMLAERTNEHQRLFVEDKEAVFFDSGNHKELFAKVNYYLSHEEERLTIAAAGFKKCHTADYTHRHRLQEMLQQVEGN